MKSILLTGVSVAVLTATALTAAAQPAAPPSPAPAANDPVEKVTVTARKRQEQARDVPAAVTSIGSQQKDNLVVDGMQDYVRQVPSATLVNSGPEYLNDFSLRGQGSGRLGFSETATGIFKDGNYSAGGGFGGRSLNRLDLFDLERLEILRGPQGALFGRNSVGGAVNAISRKPGPEFDYFLKGGYQNAERSNFEGWINLPLDAVMLRVGGLTIDQQDGFHNNLTTGNTVDVQSFNGARASALVEPNDKLSVRLTYEYYNSTTPGFANLGYRATAPAGAGGFALDPDPYTRAFMNREGYADIDEHSVFLNAEYETNIGTLSFKLNRRVRDAGRSNEDFDHFSGISGYTINGQVIDLTAIQHEDFDRTGAEIYLASRSEGQVRWLIGAEMQLYTSDVITDPLSCPVYATLGAPTFNAGCIPGGGVTANPDSGPNSVALTALQVATALSTGRQNLNHDEFTEDLESYSIFGSLDLDITEDLTAGLEARVQRDTKYYNFLRYSEDPLAYYGPGVAPAGRLTEILVNGLPAQFCPPSISGTADCVADGGISRDTLVVVSDKEWTKFTPAATLKWDINTTDTGYLRFATGYRPGGFNNTPPNGLPRADVIALASYDPEYIRSYEVGWKGRILNAISLDAAFYYTETEDAQVVTSPTAASRGFILDNAGDTYGLGFELEARTRIDMGSGRLFLNLAFSAQDGQFEEGATILLDTNGDGIPDLVNLNGLKVPRLRDYQVSLSAAYFVPLFDDVNGLVAASFQSANGGFETADNSRTYEGYDLIDGRVGLTSDRWRLTFFGRNLTDERYRIQQVSANDYYNEPRTLGLELSFQR